MIEHPTLIITTRVSHSYLKKILIQGTLFTLPGLALLFVGGTFIPLHLLNQWGGLLFILGIGLLSWGLLPYRALTLLEVSPHELWVFPNDRFEFYVKKKLKAQIPIQDIEYIEYQKINDREGIRIQIKNLDNRATIKKKSVNFFFIPLEIFYEKNHLVYFFPFFSAKSTIQLKNSILIETQTEMRRQSSAPIT